MPGPKPTPTAILENRGSWRAKEREGEPKPNLAKDAAPSELKGRALAIWKALAPKLRGAGLLTVADGQTFARYCRVYAAWEKAMLEVEKAPERQAVLTLAKLDEMLRKLEANFGLTPADRTGIRVEPGKPEVGKRRFFESK